jgi:hypothetical protein
MRNCILYPKKYIRSGKFRDDEDYRIKKEKGFYSEKNKIDELCLKFAIDPDVYGFVIDPNTGTYQFTVYLDYKYPYDMVNTTVHTYYEIIPKNQTVWFPYSFGYRDKSGNRPLGKTILTNINENQASLCNSLPTCIGYSGSTLYGTSTLVSGYIKEQNFSYFEKQLEHTIIQLGLDHKLIVGIVALSIVICTEIFFLRKIFKHDRITFIRLEQKE